MTASKLSDEVRSFLDASFPGSTIDDGYDFVRIQAPIIRQVKDYDRQQVANRICEGRCWILSVGVDPRPIVNALRAEERSVYYRPDWDVEIEHRQWLVEIEKTSVDLQALLSPELPSALVFIDPTRNVVFNAAYWRVYAPSDGELNGFIQGLEDCLLPTSNEKSK